MTDKDQPEGQSIEFKWEPFGKPPIVRCCELCKGFDIWNVISHDGKISGWYCRYCNKLVDFYLYK